MHGGFFAAPARPHFRRGRVLQQQRAEAPERARLPPADDEVGGERLDQRRRDVFPGNHWKVQGTVLGFARAHPPRSLGYVNGRCANGTDSAVEAYLREFS